MPTSLAWYNIISLNTLSMIISVAGIIATSINNIISLKDFGKSGSMIAVLYVVWLGVCGVTI